MDTQTLTRWLDRTVDAVEDFELPPDPFVDGDLVAAATRAGFAIAHLIGELAERRRANLAEWAEHDARLRELATFDPAGMPPPPPPPPPPPDEQPDPQPDPPPDNRGGR